MIPDNNYTRTFHGKDIEFTFRVPLSAAQAAERILEAIPGLIRSLEVNEEGHGPSEVHAVSTPVTMAPHGAASAGNPTGSARLTDEELTYIMALVDGSIPDSAPSTVPGSGTTELGPLRRFTQHLRGRFAHSV